MVTLVQTLHSYGGRARKTPIEFVYPVEISQSWDLRLFQIDSLLSVDLFTNIRPGLAANSLSIGRKRSSSKKESFVVSYLSHNGVQTEWLSPTISRPPLLDRGQICTIL